MAPNDQSTKHHPFADIESDHANGWVGLAKTRTALGEDKSLPTAAAFQLLSLGFAYQAESHSAQDLQDQAPLGFGGWPRHSIG